MSCYECGGKEHNPRRHLWRTLVVIEKVTKDELHFSLPGEERDRRYEIALDRLPSNVRAVLMTRWMGTEPFLHVHTNMGQSRKGRRVYSGWEPR